MPQFPDPRAALVEQIKAAFADVERGQGVSLHEAAVIDDWGGYSERAAARRLDQDSRWQEVSQEEIRIRYSELSFLDAEGMRYYLPAYMIWTLEHLDDETSLSQEATIFALDMEWQKDHRQWNLSRFALLNSAQRRAACCFLRSMSSCPEEVGNAEAARSALIYWGQFCEAEG